MFCLLRRRVGGRFGEEGVFCFVELGRGGGGGVILYIILISQ